MDKKFYTNLKDDQEHVASLHKDRIAFLIKEVGSNKKILEVGCNDGYVGGVLKKKNNDVYGIDIVKNKLEIAKKRGLKVKECDIEKENLPYLPDYFDIVILGDVIEHIFDTDRLLENSKKILRKGGKLIITTPNVASLARRIMLFFGINPYLEFSSKLPSLKGFPAVGHIRYYTSKTLKLQLTHHSFKNIKIQGGTTIYIPLKFIYLFRSFPSFFPHLMCTANK